jgi:hypothetical protein
VAVALVLAGCGGANGPRSPTPAERAQVVHWVHFWWRHSEGFAAVRMLLPEIGQIRVSRYEGHFATVVIRPLDAAGKQQVETTKIALMQVGGGWQIAFGPGDASGICTSPSPRPLVELYCP